MSDRPFRFGVQLPPIDTMETLQSFVRAAESAGFDIVNCPDHLGRQSAPLLTLLAVSTMTRLRIGTMVLNNDLRYPGVLAKEVATIDSLSQGRFELGLGAGWLSKDYSLAGRPMDPAPSRVDRLEEAVIALKGALSGAAATFSGQYYEIEFTSAFPAVLQRPHPPIMIGGGSRAVLDLAGRHADIVGINVDLRSGRAQSGFVAGAGESSVADRIGWVREAAGSRFGLLELSVFVPTFRITNDEQLIARLAELAGMDSTSFCESPFTLVGPLDKLVEKIRRHREMLGISYLVLPSSAVSSFAQVAERLRA